MTKGNIRLEFNPNGFAQILHSEACHELVQSTAEGIAERANANSGLDSFKATSMNLSTRYVGFASTTDKASLKAESEDKALTRALK